MEEKKKVNKFTIALVVIGILLIIGIVIGLSYAYWTYTTSQGSVNKITSDCIKVTITDETDAINLEKTYPITDAQAASLSPYTFKLTNSCNMTTSYSINLEVMGVENRLSSNYVAMSFNGGAKSILSSNTSVDVTYDKDDYTAVEAYNLGSGELAGGASQSYTLKLWMDESATNNDSMDKTFISKITVISGIPQEEVKEALCKEATILHTTSCVGGSQCSISGDYVSGDTITYGHIGERTNELTTGNAFDCDVNGDGTYDSATERFYYVSDYYDTETKSFDTDYATLIYYTNTGSDVVWNDSNTNNGPTTALQQLPTTSQWKNVSLKDTTRNILTESNGTRISGFSFDGYAARFLAQKEIEAGCGSFTSYGSLSDNCQYLLERTTYEYANDPVGYWMDTVYTANGSTQVFAVNAKNVAVEYNAYITNSYGVRPVIDVAKTNMEY